jgi:hypothetical protein
VALATAGLRAGLRAVFRPPPELPIDLPIAVHNLGDILVEQGLLSRAKLEVALADNQGKGCSLATYLVEKRILTSDQLALGLAAQFGVAPALEADFARADPSLRKRVVVHQAIEMQAIPLFHTAHRRVAVAMANPVDARILDRLTFMLGATVDPMVAGEVAFVRQFELLYNVRQKRRPSITVKDLPIPNQVTVAGEKRERPHRAESEIRPALRSHWRASKEPEPADDAQAHLRLAPLDPKLGAREPAAPVTVMEDAVCFTPTPMTFIPPRLCEPPMPSRVLARDPLTPVVVPITSAVAQLAVEQIRFAADQQELSDNLFAFMRSCFTVGAMFLVTGAIAQGRFGFSGGQVRPGIECLRFSLILPSCLRIARSRRGIYHGSPPPDGMAVHGALWSALKTEPPSDVLVAPVIVDGQVTLILYAQAELGEHVGSVAVGKTEQVCEALSSSLLRLAV